MQRKSAALELLSHGADLTLKDAKGRRPVDLAKKNHIVREKLTPEGEDGRRSKSDVGADGERQKGGGGEGGENRFRSEF